MDLGRLIQVNCLILKCSIDKKILIFWLIEEFIKKILYSEIFHTVFVDWERKNFTVLIIEY